MSHLPHAPLPEALQVTPANEKNQSILRSSLISLGVRLIDLPSRYGFHLLVAAALGVTDTGNFYIVFSIMVALAGFGRLGIDQALTRQLAVEMASGKPAAVRPAIKRALGIVFLASSAISIVLMTAAIFLAHKVLDKPELAVPLAISALSLIPQNLGTVFAGALAGLQRVGYSQMIYSWLWPTIFCVAVVPMLILDKLTVDRALILIAVSFALATLVGALLLRHRLLSIPATDADTSTPTSPSHLIKSGLSFFALEITKLLIASAPAIVLGIVASSYEAGLFALAWRIALIINILITGITGMAAPRFASLHTTGDLASIEKTAAQSIGLVICLALPAALCMLLFPSHLLSLFGSGYEQGATTLRILALGQIAAACFTTMPEMLGMTAYSSALYRTNAFTLTTLLGGLAVLVMLAGSTGAAAATSLAITVNGIAATLAVHRLLGILPHAVLGRWILNLLRPNPASNKTKS